METIRKIVDALKEVVDDQYYPLPTCPEPLFRDKIDKYKINSGRIQA